MPAPPVAKEKTVQKLRLSDESSSDADDDEAVSR